MAVWTLPAANQVDWTPGTTGGVGVIGGIAQYRVGGASARTNLIDITDAPYNVNPAGAATTGTIAASSDSLVVADPAGFQVGDIISVNAGWPERQFLTVTAQASVDGNVNIALTSVFSVNIAILATDTVEQIATKIRAGTYPDAVWGGNWTTGGTGALVTFDGVIDLYPTGISINTSGPAGYAATIGTPIGAAPFGQHEITNIAGSTFTVTPARVEVVGATDAVVVTNAGGAIQAAVDAAALDAGIHGVYVPEGNYRLYEPIIFPPAFSGKTFRGAGVATIFRCLSGVNSVVFDLGDSGGSAVDPQTVTGTKTKGTAAFAVADSSGYSVGMRIRYAIENEEDPVRIQAGAPLQFHPGGGANLRTVVGVVTAVSSGLVTVDPPLMEDCTNYEIILTRDQTPSLATKVGFEGFTCITEAGENPLHYIRLLNSSECWVYDVHVPEWLRPGSNGSCLLINDSYRTEVRRCDFRCLVPGSYGDDGSIQINYATKVLIEDSAMTGFDGGIYSNGGLFHSAFLYNHMKCDNDYPAHGGYGSHNLFEGNVGNILHFDGYNGSTGFVTSFRNMWSGGVYVKRFSYYMVFAGNVYGFPPVADDNSTIRYGLPNILNLGYEGEANPFTGDFHMHWLATGVLTARTSDTSGTLTLDAATVPNIDNMFITIKWGVGGADGGRQSMTTANLVGNNVFDISAGSTYVGAPTGVLPAASTPITQIWFGSGGYQELDLGVNYTATKVHNYSWTALGGATMQDPTTDTLPDSLAYAAQPDWWLTTATGFTGAWPPVDPDSPVFSDAPNYSAELIPAGSRYIYGEEGPPPPPPLATAVAITCGTLLIG